MSVSDRLGAFVADFHRHRIQNPNRAVALGVEVGLDRLPDPSAEAQAAEVSAARALLERARGFEGAPLDFEERLDLELAALALEREIHDATLELNGRPTRAQLPTAGDDIADGIFSMLVNDPRPRDERLLDILGRIEQVPTYLEALIGRLERPVRRWVEIDLEKTRGLSDLFATVETAAQGFADRPRLEVARARAEDALVAYRDRLRRLETVEAVHVGEAAARAVVALRGIDLSLEELHRLARTFLAENGRILDDLRRRLASKYGLGPSATRDEVHAHLHRAFQVAAPGGDLGRVIAQYEEERDRVHAFLAERRLFPIPEGQAMKLIRTPSFLEPTIPAGAMIPPPPFRDGEAVSLVYLTLREDLIDEHNALGIPGMIIHEGIPGHHLQLAMAARHPSVVRRHVEALEQAEGWTTMLEDYMLDLGYMGALTDEARFMGKMDIARIGARVGIDLFFMTGDRSFLDLGLPGAPPSDCDPFRAAGRLLARVTGFAPGRVEAELNWYSIERGYPLSYLAGNHLVWRLKDDVQDHMVGRLAGEELDRVFHRVFLEAGSMPVKHLRRVFAREGLLPESEGIPSAVEA